MIFRPDVSLAICLSLSVAPLLSGCSDEPGARPSVEVARQALARGEGSRAEGLLRALLAEDTDPSELAAYFGEAALQQDDLALARRWLEDGNFSESSAQLGYRMLGRLEQREGNLERAGAAFDKAMEHGGESAVLWTDIGRMRYMGGQQIEAIDAARRALALDPGNPEALRFRAQLVRDSHGPINAISWLEAGLAQSPDDVELLLDYAAALGEIGLGQSSLDTLRRAHVLDPDAPRAAYLQAVIAARGGRLELARSLLARTSKDRETPAALLLSGVLDLELGNYSSSALTLERLVETRPDHEVANRLLARALLLGGKEEELVSRFHDKALSRSGSPYLKVMVGRALEALGRRAEAARFLDSAVGPDGEGVVVIASWTPAGTIRVSALDSAISKRDYIREMLRQGATAAALEKARQLAAGAPGSGDAQSLLGDALVAAGRPNEAVDAYARAARIRLDWSLASRLIAAYRLTGDEVAAREVLETFLAGGARNTAAATHMARLLMDEGAATEAAAMLDTAIAHGAGSDPAVLILRSEAAKEHGNIEAARTFAQRAYAFQPMYRPAVEAMLRLSEDERLTSRLEAKLEHMPSG